MNQVPQLPTELISHVIKLSVPECIFATFAERANVLTSCCLVSRTWCSLAQPLLLSSVVLKGQSGVEGFLSCMAHLDPEHLPEVKELRVQASLPPDGRDTLTDSALAALFRRFPNFSYFNLHGASWICMDFPLFHHLQQCQTLVLKDVYLDTTLYGPLHFPNLRELSLCCSEYGDAIPFFSPSTVPNLQCIALEERYNFRYPVSLYLSFFAYVKVLTLSPELWNRLMENSTVPPSAHTVIIKQYSTGVRLSEWEDLSAPHLITHLLLLYAPMNSYIGLSADILWENIGILKRKIAQLTSLKSFLYSHEHQDLFNYVTDTSPSVELLSAITNFCTKRGIKVFTKDPGGNSSVDGSESMVPHWMLCDELTEKEEPCDHDNLAMEIG